MRRVAIVVVVALCCLGTTRVVRAYAVQHAVSLEELAQQADLICKAVVVSTKPVKDEWFNPVQGFQAYSAELKVISVLKGTAPAETIAFRYYGELLRDPEVAAAAALSLLSFSLDQTREILKANLDGSDYNPLFINALARENPQPYLAELAEIIRAKRQPERWWGGRIPWGVSWDILFKYAQGRPAETLKDDQLNAVLDALEYPASGDPKGPNYYSSSEPRDLYALYLQRGLLDRAKKFRAACKKGVSFDLDYFFDMVDKNPGTYQRQ